MKADITKNEDPQSGTAAAWYPYWAIIRDYSTVLDRVALTLIPLRQLLVILG